MSVPSNLPTWLLFPTFPFAGNLEAFGQVFFHAAASAAAARRLAAEVRSHRSPSSGHKLPCLKPRAAGTAVPCACPRGGLFP